MRNFGFYTLLTLVMLMVLFQGCKKKKDTISSEYFLSENLYTFDQTVSKNNEKLPVSVTKLRLYLGNNFSPVGYKVFNSKTVTHDQLIFCYKETENSDVKIVIFTVLPNEILRKQFEFQTTIRSKNDFSIQVNNLFYEDDSYIMIEGITENNSRELYIFSNNPDDNFALLKTFTATYSIFYDFIDKDNEGAKYFLLKNVVLLNNALSETNTNIQKKDIFVWDYNSNSFILSESSQIVSQDISNVPSDVLFSSDNYYNYIKGFWYAAEYKALIEKNKIVPENYERDAIRYAYFNELNGQKEVHISYGDYEDIYVVDKIIKTGGQHPGLRFTLRDPSTMNIVDYRYVDLYLNDSSSIYIKGPEDFSFGNYVRLPKPFIEYINEVRNRNTAKDFENLRKSISGVYSTNDMVIEFNNNKFTVTRDNISDSGIFKIEKDIDNYVIFFLFKDQNRILNEKYYFIDNINNDKIVLITVKPSINGYIVKNNKPITLTKNTN